MTKFSTTEIEFELSQRRLERRKLVRELDDKDTEIGHLKLELDKRKEIERRQRQAENDAQRMGR